MTWNLKGLNFSYVQEDYCQYLIMWNLGSQNISEKGNREFPTFAVDMRLFN